MDAQTLIKYLHAMPSDMPVRLRYDDGYGRDDVTAVQVVTSMDGAQSLDLYHAAEDEGVLVPESGTHKASAPTYMSDAEHLRNLADRLHRIAASGDYAVFMYDHERLLRTANYIDLLERGK